MSASPKTWTLEPMTVRDLDEVMEIERASHPTPWPVALFEGELALEWSRLHVIREPDGAVSGYVDYWLVHDEIHILNVAVAPWARRRGYATVLLNRALEDGRARRAEVCSLEVREHNLGAIDMYLGRGFVEIGRRRRYYADTGEDALIMALELDVEPVQGSDEPAP